MRGSRPRPFWLTLLLAALPAALAAPAAAASADGREVRLTDAGFAPDFLWVPAGEEVRWVNATERTQTLLGEDGSWDSGPLRPGEAFSLVPRLVGSVRYATGDGLAEGQLAVVDPVEVTDRTTPVVVARSVTSLPETGPPAPALLAAAAALLAGGTGLLAVSRSLEPAQVQGRSGTARARRRSGALASCAVRRRVHLPGRSSPRS